MAQQKRITHGATLHRMTGTPTKITQCRMIQMPESSREDVETTDLDDVVVTTIPSDPEDKGEVVIETYWTDGETNDELIDTDHDARTVASWKITIPLSTPRTWTFDAWVKKLSPPSLEVGTNAIKRMVTFRVTSAITRA